MRHPNIEVKTLVIAFVLLLATLACASTPGDSQTHTPATTPAESESGTSVPPPDESEPTLAVPTLAANPGETIDRVYCEGEQVHPIAASIAETYETAYEDVMDLYCEGHAFEEILLALETEAQSGTAAAEVLEMRAAGLTWDQVWRELDLVE